jgi:iron complex transport system substrate-binding protein
VAALALLVLAVGSRGPEAAKGWPRRITDILGREVVLKRQPRRVVLAEGLHLTSLALIAPDPVGLLAGIGGDLQRSSPRVHAAAVERFPALAAVPVIGAGSAETLSLEMTIAVGADLVVVSAWQVPDGPSGAMVETLARAGVPVVVVDFFEKPLERTLPSLRVLGRALGLERGVEAFAASTRSASPA